MKLPNDAVLVIVERIRDALGLAPNGVWLPAEKWQELQNELNRLRALNSTDRPVAPSRCELKGKTEGSILSIQAQFRFVTLRPQTVVRLGCKEAVADEVVLDDGRKPLLRNDPSDGFTVTIEQPGEHHLTLDLSLALAARGSGRGFELELPRAASTRVELELPAGSRDLRMDSKPLNDPLLEFKGNVLKGPLPGSADRFDLSWSGPAAGPGALTARDGHILVRVEEGQTVTEAKLSLERKGGEADTWKVLVPPGSEVKLPSNDEDKLAGIESDDKTYAPFASLRTLRLKGPAAALEVLVTVKAQATRPGAPTPVGPFAVPDATRQEGTILVSNVAPGVRLEFQRRGELARRSIPPEDAQNDPTLVAAFRYWGVPHVEKPLAATGPGSLALLDIEAEAVSGRVEARMTHALQLVRDPTGVRRWHLKTRIDATPPRAGVEQMSVQLPPGFHYAPDSGSTDPAVRSIDVIPNTNVLVFRLTGAEAKAFTPSIEGDYLAPAPDKGKATLVLPRPVDARDLGGQVTVTVPDDFELQPSAGNANPGLEGTEQSPQTQSWRSTRFPERVEIEWRVFRQEPATSSEVDLTLTPGECQVRQTLRFRFPPHTSPDQIPLHVPAAVAGRLSVVRGGRLVNREFLGPSVRMVDLRLAGEPPPGQGVTLVLEYSFTRGEGPTSTLTVPLVRPEITASGETKVRVWSEPGVVPLAPGGAWSDRDIEDVQGHDRYPALVLRAQRLDTPLTLPLAAPEGPTVSVLADRVLVRVAVTEGGSQSYRVGFLLERLESRHIDVELPSPIAGLALRVTLGGKEVSPYAVDDEGRRAPGGRIARLPIGPQLVKPGTVLEVSYDLPQGRATTGLLQTTLAPPVLHGDAGRVPTRWLVQLPAGWVPVGPEGGPGQERVWSRRGWLYAPRCSVTDTDLERWFAGPESGAAPAGTDAGVPSLTCWRDRPEPLHLTHAPQQVWLLACSMVVLGLGLGLYAVGRSGAGGGLSRWLLPSLATAGAGVAVASLFWPGALAAVAFGCEPGIAVLALAVPLLWLQNERHRRRAIFPPSFSRLRTGPPSSLVRGGSSARVAGEPSTVDVPRPNGNPPRSSPELPRLEGSGSGKGGRDPEGAGGPGS
jgi:hypothetical protein